jgi:YD repeat-containing protein
MTARRLRAPATDGGLLAEPPLATAGHEAVANAARLSAWDYDVQGRRVSWLRAQIRREIVDLARGFLSRHGLDAGSNGPESLGGADPPLIVTGHQPELFHPGVWVKNFAASAVAGSCGGLALNLIVDNDIPKSASIRVPRIQGGRIGTVAVDFDQWPGEIPYEDWKVRDESLFASFGDRAREALAGAVADPLLEDYWPRVLRRRGEADTPGLRFALARRELEESWGISNLELPLGAVCQSEGFLWFASHLIAQLPRYQEVHNTCLAEYRAAHRIRSRHHPVAALARRDDWLEAPFWVWRARQPRRRALLARRRARVVELRIDGEDEVFMELPLTPDGEACCAVERLRDLPARAIRLRTRALTTTMFSRFLLGDLFIHGIGGAKYDELGNEISRRFFNFEPPSFLTLSLTLWLGLQADPATPVELAAVEQRMRDLTFNPDRYVDEPGLEEVRILVNGRREAIGRPVTSRRERIARGMAIRRYNDALQPWVETLRAELVRQKARLLAGLRSNRIARNREFAIVLHSTQRLRGGLLGVANGIDPTSVTPL